MPNKSSGNPPPPMDQSEVIAKLWEMNVQREQEIAELQLALRQVMSASALECIVQNGFEGLIQQIGAQLAPLRELTPARAELDPLAQRRLETIREDLARVEIRPDDQPVRGPDFTQIRSISS